jgi:hypothetical protein
VDVYGQIKGRIRAIAGERSAVVFPAQVVAVTGTTCSVLVNEMLVSDVRLRAVENKETDQLLVVPRANSYVLVVDLSGGEMRDLAVLSCSEIERIRVLIGETSIEADADGIVFNGGELDGLVKIRELEKNLESLKDFVEAIHSALPNALTAIGTSTAASGPNGRLSYNGSMDGKMISFSDMEDTKIKH